MSCGASSRVAPLKGPKATDVIDSIRTSDDLQIITAIQRTKRGDDDPLTFFGIQPARLDITNKLSTHSGLQCDLREVICYTHRVEANDGRSDQTVGEILEISGAEVNFRRQLTGECNARIPVVAASKSFFDTLTNLLLTRTPANINHKIEHKADGDSVPLYLYASIVPDRGNNRTTWPGLTKCQRFWVAGIGEVWRIAR